MNVLVQAALGALLAAGGVTAAVTSARPETLPLQTIVYEKVERWVPSVDVTGVGHTPDNPRVTKFSFATKAECDAWVNSPAGQQSYQGLVLQEIGAHADDDTFDIADPVCVPREMDPPGAPI